MPKSIFEIRLDDKTIEINYNLWRRIQKNVRENNWFYIVYNNKKYKYCDEKAFSSRSTLFYFESLKHNEDEHIEVIVINIDDKDN